MNEWTETCQLEQFTIEKVKDEVIDSLQPYNIIGLFRKVHAHISIFLFRLPWMLAREAFRGAQLQQLHAHRGRQRTQSLQVAGGRIW